MSALPNPAASHVENMRSMSNFVVNDPQNAEYQIKFTDLVTHCTFNQETSYTANIKQAIKICLSSNNVSSKLLFNVWHSLLCLNQDFTECLIRINNKKFSKIELEQVQSFLIDPFFHIGLKRFLLAKTEYEVLLTSLRKYFLLSDEYDPEKFIPFLCALAEHCHLNEYIYNDTEKEKKKIKQLKNNLNRLKNTDEEIITKIALIGCYEELVNLEKEIFAATKESNNQYFKELVKIQIDDMLKTRNYYDCIPVFSQIKNSVSSNVAKQYEENPYPRWRHINFPNLSSEQKKLSKGKEILVAGCGTGHEIANVALYYPNASILGIDLSIPSLAYAKQKAIELNIDNIELMQADILELDSIGRKFDMILCGGVLHHMEEPLAGWFKLIDRLKPEGILKIALYSEMARQSVVLCRDWIKQEGFEATTDGIKDFRQRIIKMDENNPIKKIMNFVDFFSLSMCRDLVFHVQEHRFTLPQIKKIIDDFDMSLITLRCKNPNVIKLYHSLYPDDPQANNLDNWHEFEQKHPQAFSGMYPFWTNKKGYKNSGIMPEWVFAQ